MASYRHQSRVVVMQTLFALRQHGNGKSEPKEVLQYCLSEFAPLIQDTSFAEGLLEGVLMHLADIQARILEKAPQFRIEKFDPLELSILEIGVFELLFASERTPKGVIINEAVEMAKTFGDDTASKFINGVLSAITVTTK